MHGERSLDVYQAHELDVVVQEHINSFYDVDDVNDKKEQIYVIYFECDLEIKGTMDVCQIEGSAHDRFIGCN